MLQVSCWHFIHKTGSDCIWRVSISIYGVGGGPRSLISGEAEFTCPFVSSLSRCFSTWSDLVSWGRSAASGDISGCHTWDLGGGEGCAAGT